ncbi:hypothetical protein MUO32_26455 [Shinella sp. CPCC 101442]|uniref:hypothetical protein n=1 Tax=Shinella sp. CPCC 101442 TaxID=2932265 RepID=UPI00215247DC|nr:hypothetical protein [Shinella sp. CPCC 101442]MCR6502573.1 hypothetical protein [Shinella sp. CPCC 101442]
MSKIEEVAKALANHVHEGGDYGMTGEEAYQDRKDDYHAMARVAIAGLREPTTNMILKGLVRSERDDIELTLEEVEDIWRAMIDDALTTN